MLKNRIVAIFLPLNLPVFGPNNLVYKTCSATLYKKFYHSPKTYIAADYHYSGQNINCGHVFGKIQNNI